MGIKIPKVFSKKVGEPRAFFSFFSAVGPHVSVCEKAAAAFLGQRGVPKD